MGYGCEANLREAIKWWTKAAEQGEHCSQYSLGSCYHHGIGVRKNYKKAVYWLEKSALQDNYRAQAMLGDCYHLGEGVTKNQKIAVYWYNKATENGHVDAQYILGLIYYYGEKGVRKNYKKAFKYFKAASDTGHLEARYCLIECYKNARGTKKDVAKAVKLTLELFEIKHDIEQIIKRDKEQIEHTSEQDSLDKTNNRTFLKGEKSILEFYSDELQKAIANAKDANDVDSTN